MSKIYLFLESKLLDKMTKNVYLYNIYQYYFYIYHSVGSLLLSFFCCLREGNLRFARRWISISKR